MGSQYQAISGFVQYDQKSVAINVCGTDGVTPLNISGYTIALHIQETDNLGLPTARVLQKVASITNAAMGQAQVSFLASDLSFWGKCEAQLKITDASANTRRIGGFYFEIKRALHT